MTKSTVTSLDAIHRWVIETVEAGHEPAGLLEQMCRGGWREDQALAVIESALESRLQQSRPPFDPRWIDGLPCFPHWQPGFLSASETQRLRKYADAHAAAFGVLDQGDVESRDFWAGRTLLPNDVTDPAIVLLLRDLRRRMMATTRDLLLRYFSSCPPLYADVINFARWPPGYELKPHADRENPDGMPHPYSWRDFGAVIYVNADYEGGEIYFPTLEREFAPEPGTLAVFPGTLRFLHGVKPVTIGMRHTIAAFMTFDASKDMPF
jgi:predicted 2-oxoglutarate/Fe(II)-dependent dioxygenase YbiX